MLLALSFPKFGHPAVAWVALVPLLVALRGERARTSPLHAWTLGLVTGLVSFAGTVYWTVDVMVVYGGVSRPVATPVAGLLVAYLALYPAAFAVGIHFAGRRLGRRVALIAPAVWVTTEWARAHLLTGFPWVLLGYSQVSVMPVAQVASLFGVYGLSALVVAVNGALAYAVSVGWRRALPVVTTVAAVMVAATAWGSWRVARGTLLASGTSLDVGIVQGNVEQDRKWDPTSAAEIFTRHLALSREVAAQGVRLIVWPESSTPFTFEAHPPSTAAIRDTAVATGTWMLFGSNQVEVGEPPRYYNAAFLVDQTGATAGVYRKMHLVPFGEYVPLRRVLFFVAPLVEGVSDFSAGQALTLLPVQGHPVSVAICYEVVFPHLVRDAVRRGSQLLVTLTNDAWYGTSSAPFQHFEQARLRAIEQGRYLVRAANTGISGIVDPYGRVVVRSPLFEPRTLVGQVRLLEGLTVYGTIGDSFAWACAAVTLWLLLSGWRSARAPGRS